MVVLGVLFPIRGIRISRSQGRLWLRCAFIMQALTDALACPVDCYAVA
jgi:hypothetical protein